MRRLAGIMGVAAVGVLVSCDSPEVMPDPDYFPTEIGFYLVYDVERKDYPGSSAPVSSSYQLKTVFTDSFVGLENQLTYVMDRYTRSTPTDLWVYQETWSVREDLMRTVVQEGNTPFVKIEYPPSVNKEWNGNAFNMLGTDNYEILARASFEVPAGSFNDCLHIIQEDNQDFIVFQDYRKEIYAEGIGLVHKETINIEYCTVNCGSQEINSGFELTQTLVAYGTE